MSDSESITKRDGQDVPDHDDLIVDPSGNTAALAGQAPVDEDDDDDDVEAADYNDGEGGNDDDDDDDDEDEEEEEEEERVRRKKPRKERRNQFLDVEAEVDEEEEDIDEDEEGLMKEDGFIEEGGDEPIGAGDDRLHREVDRRREAIAEEDAERLATEYREKYGRSTASKYRQGEGFVPQRLLLPSVHDPNIWGVRCKIGKEKELVQAILKKKKNLQFTRQPLEIFSALQRENFGGYIYIEARKQSAVEQALKGFANVYMQNMVLVPIKEYPDLLHVNKSKQAELTPGSYVRIKRGKYAGDLAIVENFSENGLEARLKVVPRLDYGKSNTIDTGLDGKRKRAGFGANKARPPPRIFSYQEAMQHDPRNVQRRGPNSYIYAGEDYEHGYLIKDFRMTFLNVDSVNPKLEELTRFSHASEDGLDLASLSQSLKSSMTATIYTTGEMVEVHSGEQAGIKGKVIGSHGDIVTIQATSHGLNQQTIEIPSNTLRKLFNVGDHVRVINGNYKDDTGMVVQIAKDNVTFLSDLSQTEITVFSRDLKAASDIGGSNQIGQYELHDLVQMNPQVVGCIVDIERDQISVLTQDGQVRNMSPSSISMKVTKGSQFATDRTGHEIRVGDTVKETSGQGRQGTILHIFRSSVFLHNRDISENLGVFVSRATNVATIATKGARNEDELSTMNPNMKGGMAPPRLPSRGGSRIRLVGKLVTIGRGSQYKGMNGRVKDENDLIVRIELEAKNKVVTVDKTKVLINDNGRKVPFMEFASQRGGPGGGPQQRSFGGPGGGSAPGGGATPSWASGANSGSKTPAFGAGRAPGWSNGSKTPAWSNSGAKTPAWNSGGGKTPGWNSGSQTPGWDPRSSSAATAPTPGSFYSAPTPFSAPTPSFGATPGALSAPTPAAIKDEFTAPTPAAFDAKTPGVGHTPGAWGSLDDSETPGYEPATP